MAVFPRDVGATESTEPQVFSGGSHGSLLFRDTGNPEGANWLPDVAAGSVLVSGGLGGVPLWSDSPTLKSIVSSAVDLVYPYSTVWARHDPTINGTVGVNFGNVGGTTFGFTYQPVRFDNGDSSEPVYIDDTWHIGMNVGTMSGGVGRADVSKPNLVLSFESKFHDSQVFGQEFHLQGVTTDGVITFRPFSVYVAHNGTFVGATFSVDNFNINDRLGNNLFQVNRGNRAFDIIDSTMRFSVNNVPAIQQKNAAGTAFVNLLYLDPGNVANIGAPLYVVGPRAGTGAPIPGVFAIFQATTAQSGDTGLLVQLPSVNGTLRGLRVAGSATTSLSNVLTNDATGPNAHAVSAIEVSGADGGDPYVKFAVAGVRNYSIGIRNSDDATLTFTAASSLSSVKLLTLPSTGGLRLPKLSSDAPAPPVDNGTIFMRQTASGRMQFCARFPSGAVQVIATEP
jgi:hypothetical protein